MAAVPVKELGTLRCLECGRVYTDVPFLPPPSGLCTCPGPEGYDPNNRYRKVKWEWVDGGRDTLPEGIEDCLDVSEGRPVQIWRYDAKHHRFEATKEALEVMSQFKAPVHSVAIFGDIRQGKSLLLNQLLGLLKTSNSERFHIDPNADSFTQGIWIWSKPLVYQGKTFAFFDFQGKEGEAGFDTEMLSLLMAMTSECLVQQITTIHDPFISLEPIVNLLDMLQSRAESLIDPRIKEAAAGEKIDRALDKKSFLPSTLRFLVRDCSQKIRAQLDDKLQKIMAIDDKEQATTRYTGRNETKKQIVENIPNVVASGVCRSADDDTLSSDDFHCITEDRLYPKFVDQVEELKMALLSSTQPKVVAGKPADGLSLLSQMHMIADLINDGFTSVSVPVLRNNIQDLLQTAVSAGITKYQETAEECVATDDEWHKRACEAGMAAYLEVCSSRNLSAFSMNLGQSQLESTMESMGQHVLLSAVQLAQQEYSGDRDEGA